MIPKHEKNKVKGNIYMSKQMRKNAEDLNLNILQKTKRMLRVGEMIFPKEEHTPWLSSTNGQPWKQIYK